MSCTYLKIHQTIVLCFVKIDVNKLPATSETSKAATSPSPKSCWRMANESERNNNITLLDERFRSLEVLDGEIAVVMSIVVLNITSTKLMIFLCASSTPSNQLQMIAYLIRKRKLEM